MILFGLAGLAPANDPDGYCTALPTRLHHRRARITADAPERSAPRAAPTPRRPSNCAGCAPDTTAPRSSTASTSPYAPVRSLDRPRVLLLDEPASGMTAEESRALSSVVRRPADGEGCAVLLVEHDVSFVMELCEPVVVLGLGRVLAEGTPDEVRADPRVREAYLGTGVVNRPPGQTSW